MYVYRQAMINGARLYYEIYKSARYNSAGVFHWQTFLGYIYGNIQQTPIPGKALNLSEVTITSPYLCVKKYKTYKT